MKNIMCVLVRMQEIAMHFVHASVANQVRDVRINEGLSEVTAATCLGLTASEYAAKELGACAFQAEELRTLAWVMGVPTTRFFNGLTQPF